MNRHEREIYRRFVAADAETHEQGREWYSSAKRLARRLSARNGITVGQAAGCIASASLNQSWKGNVTLAYRLCAGDLCGLTEVRAECEAILAGEYPAVALVSHGVRATKRQNFYLNIMGSPRAVTVDRWAARAIGTDGPKILSRKGGYEYIADCYRNVADALDIAPRDLQAIVWIQVRGSHA